MIDNLLGLVQQFAGNTVNNNPEVPEDKKKSVIESAAAGLLNGFQKEATTTEGISQIIGLFGGGSSSNSGVSNAFSQNIQSSVVSSLIDKVGIKSELAKNIAGQLVPVVLSALTNSKKEGINVGGMLSSIVGDKASEAGGSLKGMLDKLAGGDDGKFDLGDAMGILGKLTGNKNDGNQSSGGGLGDLLGGLGGLLGGKK